LHFYDHDFQFDYISSSENVRYLDQRTGKCDLLFYCFSIIFGGGVKIPTIRGFIQ